MNRDRLAGGWKQINGQLMERWSRLTNDQAGVVAAKRWQIAGRVQAQHGVNAERSDRRFKEFQSRNRGWRLSK